MVYLVFALLGSACGGLAVYFALDTKRKKLDELQRRIEASKNDNDEWFKKQGAHNQSVADHLKQRETQYNEVVAKFNAARQEFGNRVISYDELARENQMVKTDLRNIAVNIRKLELDRELQQKAQFAISDKVDEIGRRYLKENIKWIGNSLNANNFAACKQRLLDVIERCRAIGFEISKEDESSYIADLRLEYQRAVRAALEREEQARIKAQIREEQKLEREVQRELAKIDHERAIIQEALTRALAAAADEHSTEIENLKARLAEAEAKQRAIAQAQLTKAGFVYVISNIGSFGEGMFKIGMTRRLEPLERVRELGSASVPFPFDVHMMISCQNAPSLETALHRAFLKQQVNKTNPRKEFFRTDIETIAKVVKAHHGEVEYTADPEALQYRDSLAMSDEDLHFIEQAWDDADEENENGELEQAHVASAGNGETASVVTEGSQR